MEYGMIYGSIAFFLCLCIVVLASVVGVAVFIRKGLSPSYWFRKVFPVMAGIGASVISLWIVYKIGTYVSFRYPYWLTSISMIDEMNARKQSELQFHLSLISVAIFIAVVLVSMLGGYIGGKVARQNEMVYGLLIGLALLLLSILFGERYFIGSHIDNLDLVFISAARFYATMVGSYFALFQRERNPAHLTTNMERSE